MAKDIGKSARGPGEQFIDPKELIERDDLANSVKIRLLEDWRSDLIQLQKACEENMPNANSPPGETASRLAQVTAAIVKLKEISQAGR